jgi:hypothetical protein
MGSKVGKKNKHLSQKKHAIRRCGERLGITLTDNEYDNLVKTIQEGNATHHSKQSNRVSRFIITLHGEEVIVVYDKHRKTIVTFMHLDPDPIQEQIFGWTKHK